MTLIEQRLFETNRPQPLQFSPHGLAAIAPEGSLEAFKELKGQSWDGHCVHAYQIATGEVVAFPEASVNRLTKTEKGDISQLPWDEVKELAIPLLSDVLDVLAGSLVHLHCEGGFYGESTAASELARFVTEKDLSESVFVTSPYLLSLRSYVLDHADLPHGWRFDRQLFGGPVSLEEHPMLGILDSDIVVCLGPDLLNKGNVSALQSRGLAVGTARLDDKEDLEKAHEAGVDWLVSTLKAS